MLEATEKCVRITIEIVCQLNEIEDMELYPAIEEFQQYGEAEITDINIVEYPEGIE